jgi:TonB family protein
MPITPPQIDPEFSRSNPEAPQRGTGLNAAETSANEMEGTRSGAPVSVVPREEDGGAVSAPVRIRTNRYGELEEHELVKLLDTIEDERARGRFRESIYISLFIWMAIVWVLFYGPKYLWHSPQLITPTEALQRQEMVRLNAPVLPHHATAAPPPKLDRATIAKLRSMEPKSLPTPTSPSETPPPVSSQPLPPQPSPALPVPVAPKAVPRTAAPVPDAPLPEAPTQPSFSTQRSAGQEMQQAMQGSAHAGSSGAVGGIRSGGGRTAGLGTGAPEILSDMQGVDFNPYISRIMREIYEQWIPLIPEEAQPPLRKQGITVVRFTINADGTIAAMHLDGSTHDDALNRAAWGSITGVGQFPPLPKQFHGPNLELRIHYMVNEPTE